MSTLTQMAKGQQDNILVGPNGQKFTNNNNIPKELAIFAIFNSAQYDGKPTTATNLSISDFMTPMRKLIYKINNPKSDSMEPIDVSTIMRSSKGTGMHTIMEQALAWYGGYTQEVRSDKVLNEVTVSGKFDIVDNSTKTLKDLKHVSSYAYKKLVADIELMDTLDNSLTLKERFEVIPTYTKFQFQLSGYHWLNSEMELSPWADIIFSLNDGGGMERYPIDNLHRFPIIPAEELVEFLTNFIDELHTHLRDESMPNCSDAERGFIPPEYKLQRVSPTNGKLTTVRGSKFSNEAEFREFCRAKARPGDQELITEPKYILCGYCNYSSICDQPI